MPLSLETLLPHLPAWTLVLFRIAGIFVLAPVLSSRAIPGRIKVLLALGLSCCVYPMLLAGGQAASPFLAEVLHSGAWLWALPALVTMELLIGLAIGFAAGLPLLAMQIAGQIADQQMGLGIAGLFNPEFDDEVGVLGQFYYVLAGMLYLIVGGHQLLLATLVGSFGHVPLGGFGVSGALLAMIAGMTNAAFELALRVSAPLLCLVFLETIVMGFLARTVPQINVLSVGFALRILSGSAVVIVALWTGAAVYLDSLGHSLRQIAVFFAG